MLAAVYPAPLGFAVPAPRPLPHRHAPSPPRGRAIQTRKGGKAALGLGGRGSALPPKNRRREGAGPVSLGAGLHCVAPPPPTARAHETRAGARRCRPRVPPAARASSLPPSTAAMVTAPGPRLRRGLFAPSAAVASAWRRGAARAALLRAPVERALPGAAPGRLGLGHPLFLRALGHLGHDACTVEQSDC